MMTFCDLSSNNTAAARSAAIAETDGCIIKATEGKTYKNPSMVSTAEEALASGKPIGFYHYARPEVNKQPIDEVMNFIKSVYPYIGKAVFFLDWEGKALQQSAQWARDFMDIFYQMTGVKMVIYIQESAVKAVGPYVQPGNYGLWVAKYSTRKPSISPWGVKLLWQFTSTPYDKSYMYGDANTWKAYAERS